MDFTDLTHFFRIRDCNGGMLKPMEALIAPHIRILTCPRPEEGHCAKKPQEAMATLMEHLDLITLTLFHSGSWPV